jgi:diguanylate cyclase (GGDEF)-like protein
VRPSIAASSLRVTSRINPDEPSTEGVYLFQEEWCHLPGQIDPNRVAESADWAEPTAPEKGIVRFAYVEVLFLRIVVIALCIMLLLATSSIKPATVVAIAFAIATTVGFSAIGNKHGYSVASALATVFDLILISATVFATGGTFSEAFLLYLLEIVVSSFNTGLAQSTVVGIACAGLYFLSAEASQANVADISWILLYRCGLFMLVGCGVGQLSKAYQGSLEMATVEHERARKRDRWDRTLADLARAVNSGLELQAMLEAIIDDGLDVLEAEAGMIAVVDEHGRTVAEACRALPPGFCGSVLEPGRGGIGLAIESRRTVGISDYQKFDKALPEVRDMGIASVVAAPILMGSDVIGGLAFGHTVLGMTCTEEECEFLEILARQLGVVLGNARLLEEARRRADYLSTINEISRSFASVLEPEALFEKIYCEVRRVIPMEFFFVATYHPQEREVKVAFMMDEGKRCPPTRFKLDDGPTSKVIMTGQPFIIQLEDEDDIEDAKWMGHKPDPTRSGIIVPMRVGPHVIGALSAQSYTPDAYGEEEIELLTTIAASAAIALENARLYQTARELSLTDDLTDLGNYRFFCNALEREIERAKRNGGPLSLVMMDSDSLKYINDRYGHAIGDMHLIHLAETMKAISRKSDILARYAGDEFMIILPNTKKEDASVMAERLRTRIENSPLSVDGSLVVATVSVGVASYPEAGSTVDELVRAVDAAMYKAKRQGKNRVVCV